VWCVRRYYPDILYRPNQPPQRRNLSDAEQGALARRIRLETFKKKHEENVHRVKDEYATKEYNKKMKDDERIKSKTGQKLNYLRRSFQDDFFRDIKTGVMQRRPNKGMYTRIWGGSRDNQCNLIRKSRVDERDFVSTYTADFLPPDEGFFTERVAELP
jgi:hypothetical protein